LIDAGKFTLVTTILVKTLLMLGPFQKNTYLTDATEFEHMFALKFKFKYEYMMLKYNRGKIDQKEKLNFEFRSLMFFTKAHNKISISAVILATHLFMGSNIEIDQNS
jgi:hypothetical protein